MKSLFQSKLYTILFWLIQSVLFKDSLKWNQQIQAPNDGLTRYPLITPQVRYAIGKVIYLPDFRVRLAFFINLDEKPNADDVRLEVYSVDGKLVHSNDLQNYSALTHLAVEAELYHRLLNERNLYISQSEE